MASISPDNFDGPFRATGTMARQGAVKRPGRALRPSNVDHFRTKPQSRDPNRIPKRSAIFGIPERFFQVGLEAHGTSSSQVAWTWVILSYCSCKPTWLSWGPQWAPHCASFSNLCWEVDWLQLNIKIQVSKVNILWRNPDLISFSLDQYHENGQSSW